MHPMQSLRLKLGPKSREEDPQVRASVSLPHVLVPPKWNATESKAVALLREALRPELRDALPFPEVVGDRRLLRFLRGHAYHVDKCAEKMRRMLQWRKRAGIDRIRADLMRSRVTGPQALPKYGDMGSIYSVYLPSRRCVDLNGSMVTIERFAFRVEDALTRVTPEDILRFHFYIMELKTLILERRCDDLDRDREQRMRAGDTTAFPENGESWGALSRVVVIRDFKGFQLGAVANTVCRNLVLDIIRTTSDYYPELMEKCFIINVPALFSTALRIAKAACEKATVEKISVSGKMHLADLLTRIDAEQLPHFLGGENTAISYDSLGEDPDVCLPTDDHATQRLCEQLVSAGIANHLENEVWCPRTAEPPVHELQNPHTLNVAHTSHVIRSKHTREVVTFESFLGWLLMTFRSQVMVVFALCLGSVKLVSSMLIGPFRDMFAAIVLVAFASSLRTAVSRARQSRRK